MPDPWLTKDGTLHPAAEWGGMPEWEEGEQRYCLGCDSRGHWSLEWYWPEQGRWCFEHSCTPYEAAALLEMDKREKLWRRDLEIQPLLINEKYTDFAVHNFITDKYLTELGEWSDNIHDAAEFSTYAAALQAAVLAMKGEDDGESTDE